MIRYYVLKWSLPVYFFEMDSLAFFSTIFGQFAISTFLQTLKSLVQFFQLISVLSAFETEMPVFTTNRIRHVSTQSCSKFYTSFKFSANFNLNFSNSRWRHWRKSENDRFFSTAEKWVKKFDFLDNFGFSFLFFSIFWHV